MIRRTQRTGWSAKSVFTEWQNKRYFTVLRDNVEC